MEDHNNILQEAAISNGIALINITGMAEGVSSIVFLTMHKAPSAPIVLASYWMAGIITLVAKEVTEKFNKITRFDTACLYDEQDPIGPAVVAQINSFVGKALLRQQGTWRFVDAKKDSRTFNLQEGTTATGYPMSTLDVPSIAAITGAPNVRFDFATGKSIGRNNCLYASHDLYIDIEGVLPSGKTAKLHTVVSDPKGQSHLTAVSVVSYHGGDTWLRRTVCPGKRRPISS